MGAAAAGEAHGGASTRAWLAGFLDDVTIGYTSGYVASGWTLGAAADAGAGAGGRNGAAADAGAGKEEGPTMTNP